jgi:hypothetical protein
MKKVSPITRLLILGVATVGLIAVILAIVGVATKNWVGVKGSTESLNKTIYTQVLPNLAAFITQNLSSSYPASLFINGAVKFAFDSVVANIGGNLKPTTYNLFDKSTNTTKINELKLPQGLVIAGLNCIFVGTVLAVIIGMLGRWRVMSIVPLLFLIIGPILITIGYLLYAKIIVEDFGHELGITVHLGYSLVLVVISSIIGYITSVFYAFTILHHRHPRAAGRDVLVSVPPVRKEPTPERIEMAF